MKWPAILAVFPIACGADRTRRQVIPGAAWTAAVWRPPTDEHSPVILGDEINASGGKFFLYKNASTYCPGNVTNLDCSAYPGGSTVFIGGNNTVSLDVAVPGGQQVYIAPDGALSYTIAHSAYMPNGSVSTGFWRMVSPAGGAPTVWGMGGRNWHICPTSNSTTGTAQSASTYQIYLVPGYKDGCTEFSMRTYGHASLVAWQYA